jgi:serine/threonine protein kinase
MTMTGELLATPAYVAPERLAGERATPASDLYSVGVLLYESLAGRQPFGTGPPAARFDAIARGRIEPIQSIRGDLPDGLVGVIERAMSRRPSDRFESADAMAAALERSLERADTTAPASTATVAVDVPPLAKTRALPPRAGGHSRKRRGMLAAFVALVLLAALAVGLLVTRNDDGSAPASPSAVSTPPTTGGPAPTSPSPLPAPLDRAIRQLERAVTP